MKKKVLADIRRKEISVRGYSKKHGISHWTMRKWIRQEKEPAQKKKRKQRELTELERVQKENEELKIKVEVLTAFHEAVTREKLKRNLRL